VKELLTEQAKQEEGKEGVTESLNDIHAFNLNLRGLFLLLRVRVEGAEKQLTGGDPINLLRVRRERKKKKRCAGEKRK